MLFKWPCIRKQRFQTDYMNSQRKVLVPTTHNRDTVILWCCDTVILWCNSEPSAFRWATSFIMFYDENLFLNDLNVWKHCQQQSTNGESSHWTTTNPTLETPLIHCERDLSYPQILKNSHSVPHNDCGPIFFSTIWFKIYNFVVLSRSFNVNYTVLGYYIMSCYR